MQITKNIPYGPYPENLLDLYLPDNECFDLFLYMHGGGLESGNKDKHQQIFTYLAENGIAAASIDYRMYPTANYPDFIEDAAAAAAWLKMNIELCGQCNRIFIGGSSAGAYLSMMLCFDKRWLEEYDLKATDFAGFFHDAGQPAKHFNVLRECGIDSRRVIVDETAPLFHVGCDEAYPPMHIVVSDNDMAGRYEQTTLLVQTLQQFGHNATMEVRHGKHCHYVGALDEQGNSILGQMIYNFMQNV